MSDSPLWDQAEQILAAIVAEYASATVTLPTRQYVSPGRATEDCEQVAITLERGAVKDFRPVTGFESSRGQCVKILVPQWRVHVVRCIPHAGSEEGAVIPPAADLDAAAAELLRDVWLVHSGVSAAIAASGDAGPCANLQVTGFGLGPMSDLGSAFVDVSADLTPVG